MKIRHAFSGIAIALLAIMIMLTAPAAFAADPASMKVMTLQVGDSEVMEVKEVSRVAVGDPMIADVVPLSTSEILLNAKSPGRTVLYTWDKGGRQLYRVIVEPATVDMGQISQAINAELKDPRITVRGVGNTIILEGTVSREAESSRAEAIARAVVENSVFRGTTSGAKSQEVKSVSRPEGESFVLEKVATDKDASVAAETGPRVPKVVNLIQVEKAIDEVSVRTLEIAAALRQALNNTAITVRALPGSVVLVEGKVGTPAEVERINLLIKGWEKEGKDDKGTADGSKTIMETVTMVNAVELNSAVARQVMVRAQVVDINADAVKEFGLNWGRVLFGTTGSTVDGGTWVIGQTGEGPFDLFGGGAIDRLDPIGARIRALEEQEKAKVLSEPNLLVLDGREGSILVGGEIPIPVPQTGSGGGSTAITIEYKEFGVRLRVIPEITSENTLQLKVMPEVSALSSVGAIRIQDFEIPALRTRRAETTVNVRDGQSLIIGGLLQNENAKFVSKIPFLGDLPIIGELFKSRTFRNNESELVIIITPQIMRPTAQIQGQ